MKAGWIVARAVDGAAVVIGHLRAGLRPGRLGQLRVPAIERKPNVKRPGWSRHVTTSWNLGDDSTARNAPDRRFRTHDDQLSVVYGRAQIVQFGVLRSPHRTLRVAPPYPLGLHKGAVCKTVAIRVGLEDAVGRSSPKAQGLIHVRAFKRAFGARR